MGVPLSRERLFEGTRDVPTDGGEAGLATKQRETIMRLKTAGAPLLAMLLGVVLGAALGGQSASAAADNVWETLICGDFFPVLSSVEECHQNAIDWAELMEAEIPMTFQPQADGDSDNAIVTIEFEGDGVYCAAYITAGSTCNFETGDVGFNDYVAGIGF
jgi:hypothetical protein